MAEGPGVGIIQVGICPGIRHFSTWIYSAGHDIGKCRTAFLACLHKLHNRFDIRKFLCKCQIDQSSGIDDENHTVVRG